MSEALDLLVGVFRSPARAPALCTRELPDGMLEVIRIAAGDSEAIAAARAATPLQDADLAVAASLLLQHLLFFDGADSYRTLGVHRDTDSAEIKRHYRWLVRWLHPDRNPDSAVVAFADRITRAWNSLRTPERRADYDRRLDEPAAPALPSDAVDTSALLRQWTERPRAPWLSARAVRRLPQLLAGVAWAVALGALALAAWLYSLGPMRPASAPELDALGHAGFDASAASAAAASGVPVPLPEEPRPDPAELPPAAEPAGGSTAAASPTPPAQTASAEAVATQPVPALPPVAAPPTTAAPPPAPASVPTNTRATASTAVAPSASAGSASASPRLPSAMPSTMPIATAQAAPSAPSVPANRLAAPAAAPPAPSADSTPASAMELARARTEPAEPASAAAPLSQDAVADFAAHLQELYAQDRVAPFLALFSPEASGNSGGYDELVGDYRRLFEQRHQRWLKLTALHWQIDGDRAVGNGDYEAWVGAAADKPAARTHGHILLELQRGAQGLRILTLRHTVSE